MASDAEFVRGSADFRSGELIWWTCGRNDAPWLVISHGGALDHRAFRPLARRLSETWRVLLWDLPGHGESQPRPESFTAAGCAEALSVVMDAAGADAAFQFGFSFGGVVAQIFAKAHPARVRGLAAYACFTPHLRAPVIAQDQIPAVVTALFGTLSWPQIVADFSARCCLTPAGQAEVARAMQAVGRDGFLAMSTALLGASDYDPQFRIAGPVVTVMGAEDSNGAPLWDVMAAFHDAYPEAASIAIPNAGHCAHLDQPQAFEEAVTQALARRRPVSRG